MVQSSQKLYLDELIELEYDEDCVAYYIVDENDNQIGVCLYEDDQQVEYLFEDMIDYTQLRHSEHNKTLNESSNQSKRTKSSPLIESIEITRDSLNDVKKDTKQIVDGLSDAADELAKAYNELVNALQLPKFPGIGGKNTKTNKDNRG